MNLDGTRTNVAWTCKTHGAVISLSCEVTISTIPISLIPLFRIQTKGNNKTLFCLVVVIYIQALFPYVWAIFDIFCSRSHSFFFFFHKCIFLQEESENLLMPGNRILCFTAYDGTRQRRMHVIVWFMALYSFDFWWLDDSDQATTQNNRDCIIMHRVCLYCLDVAMYIVNKALK